MKYICYFWIIELFFLHTTVSNAMGPSSSNLWNISLQKDINEGISEKLTPIEKDLAFKIFTGDATIKGSLEWVTLTYEKCLANKKPCTEMSALLLFQYPNSQFPADYNEGIALSNVGYVFKKEKWKAHPEWISIGRLKSQMPEVRGPFAEFIIRSIDGSGRDQSITMIREEFIWQNNTWILVKNECFIFVVNEKLTDKCKNNS